jgi:chemotaxis protein MotB
MKRKHEIPEQYRPKREEGHSQIPSHHDESNWLVSYADMMTLLCGFFIMLFSVAHLDPPKYEEMKKEVAKQFGGQYQPPQTEALAKAMDQVVQNAGIADKASVRHDGLGVTIVFRSTVFFDTMSADVKPEGTLLLQGLIQQVAKQQELDKKQYRVVVEGHTDSRPILDGPFPSNWELSAARSSRVVRMFLDKGFAPDRLTAVGYADTRPEFISRTPAGAWDEEALSKNRRVVLRILDPAVNAIPLDDGAHPATPAH